MDGDDGPGSCFLTVQRATAVECALGPVAFTRPEGEARAGDLVQPSGDCMVISWDIIGKGILMCFCWESSKLI